MLCCRGRGDGRGLELNEVSPQPQPINPTQQPTPRDERIETLEMKVMELEHAVGELRSLLQIRPKSRAKRK